MHSRRAIALSDYPSIPSQGKNLNILKGDRAGLPTGHRSHLGTFHVRFAVAVGKTLTVNVFRQRMNQLFQGVEDIWRGIAKHSQWAIALHSRRAIVFRNSHPIPSQGKI
ncbi:hypothetical protein [Cylindrospermopsis raciborskii]|uniref:hypothetical protein n=1 Tax=Cylindrospermopsis raciborskii TaxID=77022 RepID=UPI002155BF8C|nr:hypothetical protein [Cylindrospermopsis raciborskii]